MWMILRAYGSEGGKSYVQDLLEVTDLLCAGLDRLNLQYVREPHMNIVALRADGIPKDLAHHHHLVPDTHLQPPSWWKIVVMDHVTKQRVEHFLGDLGQ
jgi:glutamate/tyrosine decarboxylase-like PLP-dependent enzyme